jgi:hypothetical protein
VRPRPRIGREDRPWADRRWRGLHEPCPDGERIEVDGNPFFATHELGTLVAAARARHRPASMLVVGSGLRVCTELAAACGDSIPPSLLFGVRCGSDLELEAATRLGHGVPLVLVLEPTERLTLDGKLDRVPWILLRGTRGPSAVPMHPAWANEILLAALLSRVPVWWESWGDWVPYDNAGARWYEPRATVPICGSPVPSWGRSGAHLYPYQPVRMIRRPGTVAPRSGQTLYTREARACS